MDPAIPLPRPNYPKATFMSIWHECLGRRSGMAAPIKPDMHKMEDLL